MTAKLSDKFTDDEITGAIVAVIIIGSLIAALAVLWNRGWTGGAVPLVDSVRPPDVNFWKQMDLQQTIRFLAPTVGAYLIGACAGIWLRKSR